MEIKLKPEPKPFVSYSEYKGHKILNMGRDESNQFGSLRIGKGKANLILANLDVIRKFATEE